jgi:hypothetical protein
VRPGTCCRLEDLRYEPGVVKVFSALYTHPDQPPAYTKSFPVVKRHDQSPTSNVRVYNGLELKLWSTCAFMAG